jgi:hypothetical protein
MFSTIVIDAPPEVLVVDSSRNLAGWESELSQRLYTAMSRRGLRLVGSGPLAVSKPDELEHYQGALESANCVLVLGHGGEKGPSSAVELLGYVGWLKANVPGPKLLTACSWQIHDPALTHELLEAADGFAPLALAQLSPVTSREGGLFLLKFFTELHLHSDSQMSGRMAWFSWSKAKELLSRRGLEGRFGLRA